MPKKVGRPQKLKFDEQLLEIVHNLGKQGKTIPEIAETLGVAPSTIQRYTSISQEFSAALKAGRSLADDMVEQALFSRAIGYTTKELKIATFEGKITDTLEVDKHYPPDTAAAFIWLKNRRGHKWRDKQEHEHSGNPTAPIQLAYDTRPQITPTKGDFIDVGEQEAQDAAEEEAEDMEG